MFSFKNFWNDSSKVNLTGTYILSYFNYGAAILQNLTEKLQNKMQKLQRCVHFTFNLFRDNQLSVFLKKDKILNMKK